MFGKTYELGKQTVSDYIDDNCLSRGASIAFYTVTSLAPILVLVIAIAGLVFGQEAARGAIVGQLGGLVGHDGAELIQTMIKSASNKSSGLIASVLGFLTLMVTATGVFAEMQSSLNAIWHATAETTTVTSLVKARAQSLGLVATLGFLLMVSLVTTAALTALGGYLNATVPAASVILHILNFLLSLVLVTLLFAAIYKVLPDTHLTWQDVMVGALVTAFLFDIGKFLIGLYLGSSSVASSYGAAGALVVVLLWIYYSSQIFLLGAEFTKSYAHSHGSRADQPAPVAGAPDVAASPVPKDGRLVALPARHTAPAWSFWSVLAGVFVLGAVLKSERRRPSR